MRRPCILYETVVPYYMERSAHLCETTGSPIWFDKQMSTNRKILQYSCKNSSAEKIKQVVNKTWKTVALKTNSSRVNMILNHTYLFVEFNSANGF